VCIIYFCQTYFNEEISQNFFCFKILGHFNHLYNTILWKLIKIDGQNPHEAYLKLVVCLIQTLFLALIEHSFQHFYRIKRLVN